MWNRHLSLVWRNAEADFLASGASESLEARIQMLLAAPDIQLFLQDDRLARYDPNFASLVARLQAAIDD